jgi:hypothetical protein
MRMTLRRALSPLTRISCVGRLAKRGIIVSVLVGALMAVFAAVHGLASRPASQDSPEAVGVSAVIAASPSDSAAQAADMSAEGFARRFATELFSYDTRVSSLAGWSSRLLADLDSSADVRDLNRADLQDRLPGEAMWRQMSGVRQRATFTAVSAVVPSAWRDIESQGSGIPDGATAVTVDGVQHVAWRGGSSEVPVSVTLLLLCPPATERCVVNRIPSQVSR